jgi:phosphotransferase system enzyme I (PtsI)
VTLALTGHAVSRGIAIGRSHLAENNELDIVEYRIGADEADKEIGRLHKAIERARQQLEELAGRVIRNVGLGAGEII